MPSKIRNGFNPKIMGNGGRLYGHDITDCMKLGGLLRSMCAESILMESGEAYGFSPYEMKLINEGALMSVHDCVKCPHGGYGEGDVTNCVKCVETMQNI